MKYLICSLSSLYKKYQSFSSDISLGSLLFIPIGLLFSRGLLSIGFIAFIADWFLEGKFKKKWILLNRQKALYIISLIFLIHLIGLLHTQNMEAGLKDLKIKLPLLLPIFLFTSIKLRKIIETDIFIKLFAFSTLAATLLGFITFEFFSDFQTVDDLKNITFMGQNIMLSLFVNFSIFIFCEQLYLNWSKCSVYTRILLLMCVVWLIIFVYILNSLTGYLTFIFLVLFSIIWLFRTLKKNLVLALLLFFSLSGILFIFYINQLINEFYAVENLNLQKLEKTTINGRFYKNNLSSHRTENGHYIDIYICMEELNNEWIKVSKMKFSDTDKKGQILSETLIRYLSSRGLRKDSIGLHQLTKNEIGFIENGCANYKYTSKYSIEARIYNIIWQINTYKNTGNPNAQSISQRIEFLKSAEFIIKNHFWFGVGSGDVMDSFNQTLELISPKLDPKFRNRVHNQYIVEFTALGIFGFIIFIFIIIFPIFKQKIWNHYLFSIFYLIILLSFLTDNPLETQLGVGFFSYFYSILSMKFVKNNNSVNYSLVENFYNGC